MSNENNESNDSHESNKNGNSSDPADTTLAQRIKGSAEQIWLAGLGAYAKAEKEGNKLFESLVKDGESMDQRSKAEQQSDASSASSTASKESASDSSAVDASAMNSSNNSDNSNNSDKECERLPGKSKLLDRHIANYKGIVEQQVEEVKDRATSSWEKLEKAFDERVSRALGRLNIPTKGDIDRLAARIDELSSVMEKLAELQDSKPPASTSVENTSVEKNSGQTEEKKE